MMSPSMKWNKKTGKIYFMVIFAMICLVPLIAPYAQAQFSEQKVILSSAALQNPLCIHASDLDGDGDMDVLSASKKDNKIAWYENLMSTDIKNNANKPVKFSLYQNYPNPFNPVTVISYQLPGVSEVELSIYNLMGQKAAALVSEKQNGGSHQVEWDTSGFASGIYYYKIKDGKFVDVRKMILIK
ncbi:MAG: T9SS type A sorting domain-containing protein [Bacteroidetes bacterium]|nr:T9SS type A sorting domain-containing protein [Bacteroidota bacterium]